MNSDLIFLASSRVERNASRLDKHLDGYATIQYTPTGGLEVGYDEAFHSLVGGPYFFPAYPGPRIRFHAVPGYESWAHRHVGFRGALIKRWRDEGLWLESPQAAPPSRDASGWDEYFDELIALSRCADIWGKRRAINLLEGLLLELAEARAQTALVAAPIREPWISDLLERLAVRPEGENASPDYDAIAGELGMSGATLRRRFKRVMSISMHAYHLRSRTDAARVLLAETNMPLKAIAARLGYENEYFFSRQFKQQSGVAPGVYRKSRMENLR